LKIPLAWCANFVHFFKCRWQALSLPCLMESHFEMELDALKDRLLIMANHAEAAVSQAVKALIQRDDKLAQQVKLNDRVIDQFEVEIDDLVVQQLAKAPLADDLRLVTVVIKISHNLERVGDEASKIAKQAIALCQEPPIKINPDLARITSLALEMLKDSLDAFVNRDSPAARAILPRDRQVDALNREIHELLANHMVEHPDTIRRCLHWMVASKSLERIADHATNIAEEVVYLCEAQDIRHTGAKDVVLAH
jgi:phosphate transport system protein